MLDKNKSKRPNLSTFLNDASNKQLLAHYDIRYQADTFRNYTINTIPSNEREWCSVVERLRKDFCLPALLYDRTQEILRDTRLPTVERPLPDIRRGQVTPSHAPQSVERPFLPRIRQSSRQSGKQVIQQNKPTGAHSGASRSNMAKRSPPRNFQHNREQHNREQHNREQHNREQHNREQHNREQHNRVQYNREQYNREQYNESSTTESSTTESSTTESSTTESSTTESSMLQNIAILPSESDHQPHNDSYPL